MDKKHEDVGAVAQIDKTSVFQEGRVASVLEMLARSTGNTGVEKIGADNLTQHESSIKVQSRLGNAELYVAKVQSMYWNALTRLQILTKLALLLFTGESWGRQEATTLFFGSTLTMPHEHSTLLNPSSLEAFPE